jgi:hypothetical protein
MKKALDFITASDPIHALLPQRKATVIKKPKSH